MLSMLCRILFFLFMLFLYVNVTSTSIVILIVLGYITCVFSYYYFNNVRCAIDECFNYCNFNAPSATNLSPPQVSGYLMNRKYNKMSNTGVGALSSKKLYSPLSLPESTFAKENNLLGSAGTSILKFDYKNAGLPSPVLRTSNSSFRANRLSPEKLKMAFCPMDFTRKSGLANSSFDLARRSNSNLDMETYMNVNSPGFTSRVVGKAAESASYHMKYPTVRQVSSCRFDKSVLRQLSKIPRVNADATTATVRIASPEVACSMKLPPTEPTTATHEDTQDPSKNNNILQVLKEMSRKRNHTSEETDRSGSTPKKLRKNETRNVTASSLHKRAHEDGPDDASEYESRKRRCDEQDRAIVKMMSYTSGLGVQFTSGNQSKKRKSSKLEHSEYDSPEKSEKFRKISEESILETKAESIPDDVSMAESFTTTIPSVHGENEDSAQFFVNSIPADEPDKEEQMVSLVSFIDEDRNEDKDIVHLVGGSILNRMNCDRRQKLNSKKMDPDAVVCPEALEYVTRSNKVNDEVLKQHFLDSIISAVDGGDMLNGNVTLHQSSIVEDMANRKVVQVEVHQPPARAQTASSTNPLKPATSSPTLPSTAQQGVVVKPHVESSEALSRGPATSTNPLLQQQPVGFTFGHQPVDEVDSSKRDGKTRSIVPSAKPVQQISTAPAASLTSTSSNVPVVTTPTMTPATVSVSAAMKPATEEQTPPVTSTSINVPTSFLTESLAKTPGLVAFSTPAASATEKASTETELKKAVVSDDTSSKNVVSTSTATAPTAPLFSTDTQSTSSNQPAAVVAPKFQFSSQPGGFKFGSSQPTETKASFNVKSAPATDASAATVSPFTASTTTNAFSTDKPPSFASASNSATPSFSFGAPNPAGFDSATTFDSVPAQSGVTAFSNRPITTSAQQSTFVATNTPSLSFGGANAQPPSTAVFGGASTSQLQSSAFAAFGQTSAPADTASTNFGNATQAVGGGDSGAAFAQTGQGSTTSTRNSQFLFGDGNQTTAPTSAAFGVSPVFGGHFGASTETGTFNFSNRTSAFGSNGGATGSTFAATSGAQSGGNSMFSFGSNVNTAAAGASQSTFQFQPTVPGQLSQPFAFGTAAPAPNATTGGFSIGTGGSGATGRSRVIARSRKAK